MLPLAQLENLVREDGLAHRPGFEHRVVIDRGLRHEILHAKRSAPPQFRICDEHHRYRRNSRGFGEKRRELLLEVGDQITPLVVGCGHGRWLRSGFFA